MHFPDFDYYIYSGGGTARERFMEQFIRLFPAEAGGIRRFFDTLVKINDAGRLCHLSRHRAAGYRADSFQMSRRWSGI